MKKPCQYPEHKITLPLNGSVHEATYTIESGVVIVRYGMVTNQALSRFPSAPEHEARVLFLELLQAEYSAVAAKINAAKGKPS